MSSENSPSRSVLFKHQKGLQRLRSHLSAIRGTFHLPTTHEKCLAIGNAGLSCGYSESDVKNALRSVLSLSGDKRSNLEVIMLPDLPFALVTFPDDDYLFKSVEVLIGTRWPSTSGQMLPWFPVAINVADFFTLGDVPPETTVTAHPAAEIPGLSYIPEFISESDAAEFEDFVIHELARNPAGCMKDILKNRTALHYGKVFRYGTNDVDRDAKPSELPDILGPILHKLQSCLALPNGIGQVTVNVYEPGQGIPLHVDTHSVFESTIMSLSLGGPVVMDFFHGSLHRPVRLEHRSLLVMRDEARYKWKHGIVPRVSDSLPGVGTWRRSRRISFTFRCLRDSPCSCEFAEECDSQKHPSPAAENVQETANSRSRADPDSLEEKFVHSVYDEIATHFSQTRHKPWPRVVAFLQSLAPGSMLLDVGCGNGKYLGLNKTLVEIGSDRSLELLGICRSRSVETFASDVLAIPVRNDIADAVICIAVIHHLSTRERRIAAVKELVRVLIVNGRALLYCWAMEQRKDQKPSTYLKVGKQRQCSTCVGELCERVDDCSSALSIHTNRTEFREQDVLVPWHLKKPAAGGQERSQETYHRYYHVFREGELEELVLSVPGVSIESAYYDEGNWCVILRKVEYINK